MKCSFFALLCLLLISLPVGIQAQTSGEFVIKGQVIDSLSNETVPYALLLRLLLRNRCSYWLVILMGSLKRI